MGVTNNIVRRLYEHKNKIVKGFTAKYGVDKLVYVEIYESIEDAIYREKCIKKWNKTWKIRLIESANPQWQDLIGGSPPTRG